MYTHTNIHIHTYTHMHVCVYAVKYTYVPTHIHKHTSICTYTYLLAYTVCVEFFPFEPISLLAKEPSSHSARGTDTGAESREELEVLRCNL